MIEVNKAIITSNAVFDPLELDPNELVNFLRFIDDDRARHLIKVYDSLSARQRKKLDIDMLASKAGYSKKEVRSIILSALVEYEIDCTKLLIALSMPEIVKKTIQSALGDEPNSSRDRIVLLEYYLSEMREDQAERKKEFPGLYNR